MVTDPLVNRQRLGVLLVLLTLGAVPAAQSRPVICSTTLEAPPPAEKPATPLEVTRCAPVQTTTALVEERFYTWTAPFSSGVDLLHQVTDVLGIAVGGVQGNRIMGFGFPDQTIIWDGTALQNTYEVLLEEQSDPVPWRTVDIFNGFDGSLAEEVRSSVPVGATADTTFRPVPALW